MHFLGLAGMPRRIPDYPDAYTSFNTLATFGAFISIVATFYFFSLVYTALSATDSKTRLVVNYIKSFISMLFDSISNPLFNIYRNFSNKILNKTDLSANFINILLVNIIAKERAENDIPYIVEAIFFYKQKAIKDLISSIKKENFYHNNKQ
jgi:heme/copper-type cytochrome/quinol oxidase subunit 1